MYTLQAIILEKPAQFALDEFNLSAVEISPDLFMVPLTHDYVDTNDIPFLPLTDEGLDDINGTLLDICLKISSEGKAVYVEAEYFGGAGTQGCALFESGSISEPAQKNDKAINHALRWLGVSSNGSQDEFAVVGLGRHRSTQDWLDA